jgi:hypothetical protein
MDGHDKIFQLIEQYILPAVKDQAVESAIDAPGALALTEAIPFSSAAAEEYISLVPMIWPLAALRTKYDSLPVELLRSK